VGSVRHNHKDWGTGTVLGSDLQRGGTHARYRPAISGAACAGCAGCAACGGVFSRARAAGRPHAGVRGVLAGAGGTPGTPRNTRFEPTPATLWTHASPLTRSGGRGRSSNALYGYSSPLPLARQCWRHRFVSPSEDTCLPQPAGRAHDRSFFWVGTGIPGIFTLTAPKCVRLVK
jgi:hypothetical protein